ncbi:hypothetical protein [Kribbella sp. VKM Ac-2571]|uniref:hypothetical protein n=1 Tax=Kribbella sp. VKM Ac-2571 TaxID=2512222 RepID=UPI00106219E9|nr:hypothetical protein [Kribbella sp. VKM Ac-2571]
MADRFDLDAIEADDALLDLLAAGGESARAAGEHDPAVALLADLRLAVEVEDELPVETIDDPESFLARCAALNPVTDPFARKMATRGLAFGVAAVAALSVSGVAAAVTGDPLSPYEKVIEKMVDAVRPQTSFPKEDLDGLPVVDRSKIVKVGKDFQAKATAQHAAENAGKGGSAGDDPQAQDIKGTPEVVVPPGERPVAFPLPIDEQKTQGPVKPTTEVTPTDDTTTAKPTDTTTTKPADPKTTDPTDTKTTETPPDPPKTTPTDEPTDTPTPTPTDPTTTTPPTNGDTGTGDTGTGDNNTSTGEPTATPSAGAGEGQTSDGETTQGSDSTTTPAGDTGGTSGSDTSGTDTSGAGETPGSDVTQVPDQVKEIADVVETIVAPVLPTPSGEPVANETTERFFGTPDATAKSVTTSKATAKKAAAKPTGKHASGTVSTGSVRKAYPKGKHSSGAYAEGKHAAIARTYGSTADASLLQILDVVNAPIK